MDKQNQRSILDMARGAFQERVDCEMAKVIDNILDPSHQETEDQRHAGIHSGQ